MRAKEFLKEYDPKTSDDQLKKTVISMLKSADRELLDKVYQTLSTGDFDTRIEAALGQDEDAKIIKDRLAQIIVSTKGNYSDKVEFLNKFNQDVHSFLKIVYDFLFRGRSILIDSFERL